MPLNSDFLPDIKQSGTQITAAGYTDCLTLTENSKSQTELVYQCFKFMYLFYKIDILAKKNLIRKLCSFNF